MHYIWFLIDTTPCCGMQLLLHGEPNPGKPWVDLTTKEEKHIISDNAIPPLRKQQ